MDESIEPAASPENSTSTETEPAPARVPAELWIDELHEEPFNDLLARAESMGVRVNAEKTRHHIVFELLRVYASRGTQLFGDGIIELSSQGSGFVRWPRYNFRSLPQDLYLGAHLERQFHLRNGNRITARIRPPRDREKFMAVEEILSIEGIPAAEWHETTEFDKLTALHPCERIVLENP